MDELTGHRGADDVVVAVGSKKAIESAQKLVGRGAVLNLFGGLKKGEDIVGIDASAVHYKEINVTGSSGVKVFRVPDAMPSAHSVPREFRRLRALIRR